MLARIDGLADLAMTTNGLLLDRYAAALAAAGLRRVNVSLDAIDPERYAAITRGGDVRRVLAGIDAARQAGLNPVKLNCVIGRGRPMTAIAGDVAAFCPARGPRGSLHSADESGRQAASTWSTGAAAATALAAIGCGLPATAISAPASFPI